MNLDLIVCLMFEEFVIVVDEIVILLSFSKC
jgi:hypothetical protein